MEEKLVTGGFLTHEGKVLLVRRAPHETFLPGVYELPGGKVEKGESLEDGLVREFKEEVNLDIKVEKPYYEFSYDNKDQTRHYIETHFLVELKDTPDNIKLSDEHDDLVWLAEDQLDDYLKVTDEIKQSVLKGFKEVK